MYFKIRLLYYIVGFFAIILPRGVLSQNTMPNLPRFGGGSHLDGRVQSPPSQSSLLTVTATRPLVILYKGYPHADEPTAGSFRIAFKVTSPSGTVPISTIRYGGYSSDFILDWRAFSSSGANCLVARDKIRGVDTFSGGTIGAGESLRKLMSQNGAGSTTPTIISADFSCDSVVRRGDRVTVQIKIFALWYDGWKTASYSFDELQI